MAASSSSGSPGGGRPPQLLRSLFGDTMLTKVFVGGLSWQISSEGLRRHFERYGEILEAVVITDRFTGRSKGYGFVTFRKPEAAELAVQDPNPVIAGRRANCNIASLGPPLRGMAPPGTHLQAPPPAVQGPPSMAMAPPQMLHRSAVFFPSQYWHPPDYQYQYQYQYQQALLNPQMVQNYYAQLYGLTSPSVQPYHHYIGCVPTPRAGVLLPAQQAAHQPFRPHPTAQIQDGSSIPVALFLPRITLQLPPQAASGPSADTTDSQLTQPTSEAGATDRDNQGT